MMPSQKSALGKYIYDRRRALDLSRAALANLLTERGYECSDSAVNHWESGRAMPPIDDPRFARALASALEVAPSELIRISGILDAVPAEVISGIINSFSPGTLRALESATPQQIKKLEALIRVFLSEGEQDIHHA